MTNAFWTAVGDELLKLAEGGTVGGVGSIKLVDGEDKDKNQQLKTNQTTMTKNHKLTLASGHHQIWWCPSALGLSGLIRFTCKDLCKDGRSHHSLEKYLSGHCKTDIY